MLHDRLAAVSRKPRPLANPKITRALRESSARKLRERTRRWSSLLSSGVRIKLFVSTQKTYPQPWPFSMLHCTSFLCLNTNFVSERLEVCTSLITFPTQRNCLGVELIKSIRTGLRYACEQCFNISHWLLDACKVEVSFKFLSPRDELSSQCIAEP